MVRTAKGIIFFLVFCLLFAGCGPSYPKAKAAQYVVDLCKKEYGINVRAKLVGNTLGTFLEFKEGLFDEALLPTEKSFEKIGNVFFVMTRVALASDADIKFCRLIAVDLNNPGLQMSVTRALDDTRKLYNSFISKEENDLRTDIDYAFNPILVASPQKRLDFDLEEVKLTNFLAKQIANRIKYALLTDKLSSAYLDVKMTQGALNDRKFLFSFETQYPESTQPVEALDKYVLEIALRVAADVLDMYRFKDFDLLSVSDKRSRKIITVRRDVLRGYVNKKIKIGN